MRWADAKVGVSMICGSAMMFNIWTPEIVIICAYFNNG